MASNFPQDFIQEDRFINRRYFQIPTDQKQLLDSNNLGNWYENLNRGPHPMVNVPSEVLEHLHRPKSAGSAQTLPRVQPATPNAPSTLPGPVLGQGDEENADGTPLSWTPSPSRRSPDQSSQHVEQTPPLRRSLVYNPPEPQSKSRAVPTPVENVPSSSAAQSEVLEIQPPEALNQDIGAPINRPAVRAVALDLARPVAIPPSAQEQSIPGTFSHTGQSDEQQPPAKKQRRMAETALPERKAEPRERPIVSKTNTKTSAVAFGSRQESLVTSISTPSMNTQAATEHSSLRDSSLPKTTSRSGSHRDSSYNPTPTWEGRRNAMASQREKLIQAPESSLTLPGPRPAQAAQRGNKRNSTRQSLPPAQGSPNAWTPYEKFTMVYPDYQESVYTFVSALLNVEILKRDWALAEFLYDDFIRAFSTGYLQYIAMSLVRHSNQILTAVQWYNDNVKTVHYCQKVITKGNIHDMIKGHPAEVRKVQESIGGSGFTVDGVEHEEPDKGLEDGTSHDEHDVDAQGPLEDERKEAALVAMSSPELHIASPGAMEVDTTTTPMENEASLMSLVEPMNGGELPHMMTESVLDINNHSSSDDAGLGKRSQRQYSIAKGVNESIEGLLLGYHGEEASNQGQNNTLVDRAAEEKEPAPTAEIEHAMEDGKPRSRTSPELSIRSPGPDVASTAASIEDERSGFVDGLRQEACSPSGSFASQDDLHMEDYLGDEEPEDNPESPVAINQPRTSSATGRQSSEVVFTEGVHRNGATPEGKATSGISMSPVARESVQGLITNVSTSASGTSSSSRHGRPNTPPPKEAQRSACMIDESSDEEEAFDPPTHEVGIPKRRTATLSFSAMQTKAPLSGEQPDTTHPPAKVTAPLPRSAARSSPASRSGFASQASTAPAASTATAAAPKQAGIAQKTVTDSRRVLAQVPASLFSGEGKSGSPVSSGLSHADVPRSKKRANETREERSRRLKEHLRRRLLGKTLSSTPVSK